VHKLLIVDDDGLIRKGLSTNIDWANHGLQLIGTAKNGLAALELMESTPPDIVITDIRMPFMDGLELTKMIKHKMPKTKIIMMTSYEEFEFAKEALKMKVFDYLLKPMGNEVLLECVKRAAAELEHEDDIKKKVLEGLPLLKLRFFESLMRGKLNNEDITAQTSFLGLSLSGAYFAVAILKADDYSASDYESRFGKEMLKYCIQNVAEEIVSREQAGLVYNSYDDETIVIYMGNESEERLRSRFFELTEEIRASVERYLKTTITAGIGALYKEMAHIAQSYIDAKSAVEFRHLIGQNKVLSSSDTALFEVPESIELFGKDKQLVLNVRLGLKKEALQVIDEIEEQFVTRYVTLKQVYVKVLEMFTLLNADLNMKDSDSWLRPDMLYERIQRLQTIKDIFDEIRPFVTGLIERVNQHRESQQKQLMSKAIQFIEANYSRERLSLNDVAGEIHISPTYFSYIFKQEQHMNFSDFLLEIRMKKAKELLRLEDMKTYEVAERVGYNAQYFSTIFKKHTGYSPSEFRETES
jgi:two-component system response regulator YesN